MLIFVRPKQLSNDAKIETMENLNNKSIEEIAAAINAADRAISVNIQGGKISGCYRGKSSESYQYFPGGRKFNGTFKVERVLRQLGLID